MPCLTHAKDWIPKDAFTNRKSSKCLQIENKFIQPNICVWKVIYSLRD